MKPLMEILRQINELSGVALDALGKAGGGGGEGGPAAPEGAPPQGEVPPGQ
jgi:hypothetical protein